MYVGTCNRVVCLNISGWIAALKETLYYAFSLIIDYNNSSPSPTIRKSHEPPLFPTHREQSPCSYKYQLENTCEDANPYLLWES
jgi:hypothetical protein